jgi:hypothetical protein
LLLNIGEAMGLVQHHDGISGTEKQAVAFDYAQRLSDGIDIAQVCSNNKIFRSFMNISYIVCYDLHPSFKPCLKSFILFVSIQNVINQAYSKLLPKNGQPPPSAPQFLCQLSNISQCLEIDGQEHVKT